MTRPLGFIIKESKLGIMGIIDTMRPSMLMYLLMFNRWFFDIIIQGRAELQTSGTSSTGTQIHINVEAENFCYNSSSARSKMMEFFNMVFLYIIGIDAICWILFPYEHPRPHPVLQFLQYHKNFVYTDTNYMIVCRFVWSVPTHRGIELFSSWCLCYQKIKSCEWCADYYFMWMYMYRTI